MRDRRLADLNFRELLHYGCEPPIQNTYDPPLACSGYCVHCEEQGNVFYNAGDSFDLMSHGCDTSVYEELLGPIPNRGRKIEVPIMFLLENPGGREQNHDFVEFRDYKKRPPVNHYYWTPSIETWLVDANEGNNRYGDYFAYLMNKHDINNIYITNLIKCNTYRKPKPDYNYNEARSNCVERWFSREMEIFDPKIVFFFGHDAKDGFHKYAPEFNWSVESAYLYHPGAIELSQRYHKTPDEMITENDSKMDNLLRKYRPDRRTEKETPP